MAVLVALAAIRPARAGCPITVRGSAEVARAVSAELQAFPADDLPCVPLVVRCVAGPEGIDIELRDTLGGIAQRSFATPGGVAAFLLSWSRRPVAGPPGAAPVVPPPRVAARPAAVASARTASDMAPRDPQRGWHAEVGAGGMLAGALMGHLHVGALHAQANWDIGFQLRGELGTAAETYYADGSSPKRMHLASHLDLVFRRRNVLPCINVAATVGGFLVTRHTDEADQIVAERSSQGMSMATRAELDLPAVKHVEIVLGLGLELFDRIGGSPIFGTDTQPSLSAELDFGIRWWS